MRRDELFERFPPLGGMLPGPIPSYIATGAGGNPVQVHLIDRDSPSFPQLADLVQKAQASPPTDPFQILDLPDELAVVTGGLPPGVGFEEWLRDAVSGPQAPAPPPVPPVPSEPPASVPPPEESYTQYFQLPKDPPAPTPPAPTAVPIPTTQPSAETPPSAPPPIPDPPPATSDYSEFFQTPVAGEQAGQGPATPQEPDPVPAPPAPSPPEEAPAEKDGGGYTEFFQAAGSGQAQAQPSSPPEPSTPVEPPMPRVPVQPPAPPPPPPPQAGPPPSIPTQLAVPAQPAVPPSPQPPAQAPKAPPPREPDPDSITAEFRKPMPPPPRTPSNQGRNWAPSQGGANPEPLAMGDYLTRLDSSSGSPVPKAPRPPVTPAAPSWASDEGAHAAPTGRDGPSSPPEVSRAPPPQAPGAAPGRRFRTRDLVIFGIVIGAVVIAAIVAIVMVILSTD